MSKFEFRLPDIGEGVSEGEIVSWLVEPGQSVTENEDMVEVMTDKATVTIGAPRDGKVDKLHGNVGDVVAVGSVLVVLEVGGAAESPSSDVSQPAAQAPSAEPPEAARQGDSSEGPAASAVGDIKNDLPGMALYQGHQAPAPVAKSTGHYSDKPLAAPATRKLARELGVDLRTIPPTGKSGQVTREDVERFVDAAPQQPAPTTSGAAVGGAPAAPLPRGEREERQPIRGLRKRIYENMARSKRTAAHFTYVDECDVTALKELRSRTKSYAAEQEQRLTFLPFIVKAVVSALKKNPKLNCLVDDASTEIVQRHSYDIGIAVSTDSGLIVPVIRDADRLSILGIAREIDRIAAAARAGKSAKEDLGGSSFTITSLGKAGGLFATPVINYPEVGILGVHQIKRRPVVRGDEIVIGDVMLLSLSFDHRIIDGDVGAAFAQDVIALLEVPDRLLLDG